MPVEDCENNNSQESLEQDFKEKLDLESESRHVQLECIWMMMVVIKVVVEEMAKKVVDSEVQGGGAD